MARARFAASAALVLLLVLGLSARGPSVMRPGFDPGRAAAVGWPPSTGLCRRGGRHGRRIGVRRVGRAVQRVRRRRRPGRPGGRLRHELRGDGDPQGVVDRLADG